MKKKYSFLFVLYKSQSKSTSPSTDFRHSQRNQRKKFYCYRKSKGER